MRDTGFRIRRIYSCRSSRPNPAGSGIRLVLSRQIAEAHGGSLDLRNRVDTRVVSALILPLERGLAEQIGRRERH
jgi:signal transduction histidine kinase